MSYLGLVSLLVREYDEAIQFYTQKLDFRLEEDAPGPDGRRWIVLKPKAATETGILLVRARNEAMRERLGQQVSQCTHACNLHFLILDLVA